jgi:hypothetical protein
LAAEPAATQPVNKFTPQEITTGSCWIDAKTGERVPTGPGGWLAGGGQTPGGRFNNPDENHVEDSQTGRTFVHLVDGSWVDAATGQPVPTGPGGWLPGGGQTPGGRFNNPDNNHVEDAQAGRTFVRVPCPPPVEATQHAAAPRSPSSLEIAVLNEINAARTDPHAYAHRLRPAPYVDISDAAAFLAGHATVPPLSLNPRLAGAAIAHADDQGPKGGESHTGSDGSRPRERMHTAGVTSSEYAEVISVGYATGAGVVQQLLVDQPGPQHPHRDDLFDPSLQIVGVGCAPNTTFTEMCVIDLAGAALVAGGEAPAGAALASPPKAAVDLYDQLLPRLSPQQLSLIDAVAGREANDAAMSEDKVRSELFDTPSSGEGLLDNKNMSIDDILFAAFMDVLKNMDKQIQSQAAQVNDAEQGPAGPQAAELREEAERRAKVLEITDQLFEAVNRAASALGR